MPLPSAALNATAVLTGCPRQPWHPSALSSAHLLWLAQMEQGRVLPGPLGSMQPTASSATWEQPRQLLVPQASRLVWHARLGTTQAASAQLSAAPVHLARRHHPQGVSSAQSALLVRMQLPKPAVSALSARLGPPLQPRASLTQPGAALS